MKNVVYKMIMYLFRIFPIKKNKIVIASFYGKGYGDSSKYICDEIFKRQIDFEIVWLVNDLNEKFPPNIKKVKYKSIRALYELCTARIWIDNSRKPIFVRKRKKQFYIQTWHSNLRLKKIEKDAEDYLLDSYVKQAINDSKMADAIIAGCDYSYNTIKNSFWYDGPIYKTGIPRCDELFDVSKQSISKIKKDIGIEEINHIFLYAPTFRNNMEVNLIDYDKLLKALRNTYAEDFVFLVRFHPISKQSIIGEKNLIDVTSYPNMQELIKISNILITDYSGCMFDAAISRKKCILYVPDLNDYISKQRELYFKFGDLPFNLAYTQDELVDRITNFNDKEYYDKLNGFLNLINSYEQGTSARKVVNMLEKVLNNEKI